MAGKALASVRKFLSNLSLKAPWRMTGVASTNEFLTHLPMAGDYRAIAPGSQPLKPMVPQALPETVYDIKYFVRDTRRAGMLIGGTNKTHVVKYDYDVKGEDSSLAELDTPPTPGAPYQWKRRRELYDYDNNGYT